MEAENIRLCPCAVVSGGRIAGTELWIELWLREKKGWWWWWRRGGGPVWDSARSLGDLLQIYPCTPLPGSSRGYERRRGRGTFLGIISGGAE